MYTNTYVYTVNTELGRWLSTGESLGLRYKQEEKSRFQYAFILYPWLQWQSIMLAINTGFCKHKNIHQDLFICPKFWGSRLDKLKSLHMAITPESDMAITEGPLCVDGPILSHRHDVAIIWRNRGQSGIQVQVWAGISFGRCVLW